VVGSTVIVMVAVALSFRAPTGQVMVGAVIVHEPWVVVAEMMVRAALDRVVAALTSVALSGPSLVTVAV
jgi:hypothetical protein